jgi:hypothetical protein
LGALPLIYGCWEDARATLNNEHILIKELQRRCEKGNDISPGISQIPKPESENSATEDHINQQFVTVEAGASFSTPCTPGVQCVHVALKTDGHLIDARIELLQGGKSRSEIHVSSKDGRANHFNNIIDTPGSENIVTITNYAGLTLAAAVEPHNSFDKAKASSPTDWGLTSYRNNATDRHEYEYVEA